VLLDTLVSLGHLSLLRHIQWDFVSTAAITSLCKDPTESVWLVVSARAMTAPGFDSLIVSEFPPLFEEFRVKHFNLLWRGSRDGFTAQEFHRRCDGHANTLTIVMDTKGNIFGGFTPVTWDSNRFTKTDNSLRSFLFTLKNPHGVLARKFPLKAEEKHGAICCYSHYGPSFNGGLHILDRCNANNNSYTTYFGDQYVSVTGRRQGDFFTGENHFTAKEIEVFEIADEMTLQTSVVCPSEIPKIHESPFISRRRRGLR
jgi:hypothetical protein